MIEPQRRKGRKETSPQTPVLTARSDSTSLPEFKEGDFPCVKNILRILGRWRAATEGVGKLHSINSSNNEIYFEIETL